MEYFLFVFILLSPISGVPVYNSHEGRMESKVVDFTDRVGEVGEEYNEKTEVDPNKRTELFHGVRAHPGVDRSDTLHDFKQDIEDLRENRGCPCLRTCGSCYCCVVR
ncbi:uncharacterized protein [Montipora foliosa]|uniref:uncharacterized protein n=1 Tax=Montipora foliosa TaxID=591990 RepID=UPI0035F1346B